jgi:uncharacterized delta-60 repeat protein
MNESGTFRIESADPASPRVLNWTANKRFGNTEQTCPSGYAGDPIPANTYFADTQIAANTLAASELVCTPDTFIPPTINGYVEDFGIQSDGKVVIVGSFTSVHGFTQKNISRLNIDGSRDTSVGNLNPTNAINSVVVRDSDKVVVSGYFNSILSTTRRGVAGLNSNLSIDSGFADPALSLGNIWMSERADGKIYAQGDISGEIKLINTDGTVDGSFVMSGLTALGWVVCAVDGVGVLVDGYYGPSYGIYRLGLNGALDGSFLGKKCNSEIRCIKLQSDGKIIVGGAWSNFGGDTSRDNLIRLTSSGSIDTSFTPPSFYKSEYDYPIIEAVAVEAGGKIIVVGQFTEVGGVPMAGVVRLNTDGSIDPTWPNLAVDNTVMNVKIRADGRIVVCGQFSSIGGHARSKIAAIAPNGTVT